MFVAGMADGNSVTQGYQLREDQPLRDGDVTPGLQSATGISVTELEQTGGVHCVGSPQRAQTAAP